MKTHIIFRFTAEGIAARNVDFPQLGATGYTVKETEGKMVDAIQQHVEQLQTQSQWDEPLAPSLEGAL